MTISVYLEASAWLRLNHSAGAFLVPHALITRQWHARTERCTQRGTSTDKDQGSRMTGWSATGV